MRREITGLHRDFTTGRLMAYGRFSDDGWRGGEFSRIILEPICDADRELIGDMPIPPVLAKVDL